MNHERTHPPYRVLHDFEAMRGTMRQGSLTAPYSHLVDLFGEPLPGDGRKTNVQWIIETEEGVSTIYDYSIDEHTMPVEDVTDWHVGGKDETAYRTVIHIVEGV